MQFNTEEAVWVKIKIKIKNFIEEAVWVKIKIKNKNFIEEAVWVKIKIKNKMLLLHQCIAHRTPICLL